MTSRHILKARFHLNNSLLNKYILAFQEGNAFPICIILYIVSSLFNTFWNSLNLGSTTHTGPHMNNDYSFLALVLTMLIQLPGMLQIPEVYAQECEECR